MTTEAFRKLERMQRHCTRYELALEHGSTRYLVAYSMRQGRHTILTAIQKHGPTIIDVCGITDSDMLTWRKPAALGAMLGQWRVYFTGRTQRDAISNGELPWIGDYATKAELIDAAGQDVASTYLAAVAE